MKKYNKKNYFLIVFLLFTTLTFAQLPSFDDSQNDSGTAAPISSLVALGLLAGAAYGIKKMK